MTYYLVLMKQSNKILCFSYSYAGLMGYAQNKCSIMCVASVCMYFIFYPTLVHKYFDWEVIKMDLDDDLIELEIIELQEKREELLNLLDEMEISNPAYNDLEDEIEYLDNLINNLL